MKKTIAFLAILIIAGNTYAQSNSWQWAQKIEALNEARVFITVAPSGETYAAGHFEWGQVILDTVTLTATTLSPNIFFAKYNSSGAILWAKNVSQGLNDNSGTFVHAMTTDQDLNFYVTGAYYGSVYFDSTLLSCPACGTTGTAAFTAKYDSTGNLLWVKAGNGTTNQEVNTGLSVASDTAGNCYVTGSFDGTTLFDTISLTSAGIAAGGEDAFIAKYNSNGNLMWAKRAGSPSADNGSCIKVDKLSNVYVCGNFDNIISFDSITLNGGSLFLTKLDSNGTVIWAKHAGNLTNGDAASISLAANGDIYFSGRYTGTAPFDSISLTSVGNSDLFLAKYNSAGQVLWAKSAGGLSGADVAHTTIVDSSGNCYVGGRFSTSSTFDGFTITGGSGDIFVAKYDVNGNALWAIPAGGAGTDYSMSIGIDSLGDAYLSGYSYSHPMVFDSMQLTNPSTQAAIAFVAKVKQASNLGTTDIIAKESVTIYPNPLSSMHQLNLKLPNIQKQYTLNILDANGRIMRSIPLNKNQTSISLTDLPKGIYLYTIFSNLKKVDGGRLILN